MKLETSVKVYFDDVQGMVNEVKKLQTYKLFEGDDMVLVDLDAVVTIMANHIMATDNCSEFPNSWILCSERLPEVGQNVLLSIGKGMFTAEGCLREDGDWYQFRWSTIWADYYVDAWMPLPEPYKEGNDAVN